MWSNFDNSSITITEVVITLLISQGFDQNLATIQKLNTIVLLQSNIKKEQLQGHLVHELDPKILSFRLTF